MVDRIRIENNLNYISDNLNLLCENIKLYEQEENKLKKKFYKNSMSKFVEEIVEKAIKINSILLKEKGIFFETYYNSFIKLNDEYILNFKDINLLAQTTSFRNNLVHNYDNNYTQFNLENNLESFIKLYEEYLKVINLLLNKFGENE